MSYKKKPKAINPDEVDPSVYYYDEVYDDMKKAADDDGDGTKQDTGTAKKKESKYIQGIISTAEIRKSESELRKFKRYARDRQDAEENGDLSRDDVYVTPAYKRKLEEMRKLESEKRQRIQEDESKTLNYLRHPEKQRADQVSETKIKRDIPQRTEKASDVDAPEAPDASKIDSQDVDNSEIQCKPMPRKKLVTIEDRREYLRDLLAKRTVGKVFDEAVERYKERKKLRC